MKALQPRTWLTSAAVISALLWRTSAGAQQVAVGQKLLGTAGIQAGVQANTGVYVVSSFLSYAANEVADRNGAPVPIGLDGDAFGESLALAATFELRPLSIYVGAAISVVAAHLTLHTESPLQDAVVSGLGDLPVQPIRLGWRTPRVDLVTSYGFYAPTGKFAGGGDIGLGQGQWTHEVSLGGTVYFDAERTWYLSAVGAVDVSTRKQGLDYTRGTTIQVQGGVGKTLARIFDVGLASYALGQVSDDRGADVPYSFRGARQRAFGLGPEIGLTILPMRSRFSARYTHDVVCAARPEGQLLMLGLTVAAWMPSRHD